jgi:PadR family transcriptional regulator PadR
MKQETSNDILQGTMTMLVLKTLGAAPLHGYAITQRIHRASEDLLRVEEGSLYPALRRMEQKGWISAEWGITEANRRARFYALTHEGRERLNAEEQSWERLTRGVTMVLQTT